MAHLHARLEARAHTHTHTHTPTGAFSSRMHIDASVDAMLGVSTDPAARCLSLFHTYLCCRNQSESEGEVSEAASGDEEPSLHLCMLRPM